MARSKPVMLLVLGGVYSVLLADRAAVAQPTNRQPTRRVEEQPGDSPQRQPLRAIPRRRDGDAPRGNEQAEARELRRELIVRPPQMRLRPVRPQWRLGVAVDEAPKGLRIRDVSRNSPAARFGLEPGDYLLDVMGYPVGFYRSFYYPLGETLNQVAPRDGWVNVLVWNKRTLAEEALWLQLEPRGGIGIGLPLQSSGRSERDD